MVVLGSLVEVFPKAIKSQSEDPKESASVLSRLPSFVQIIPYLFSLLLNNSIDIRKNISLMLSQLNDCGDRIGDFKELLEFFVARSEPIILSPSALTQFFQSFAQNA